MVLIGRVVKPHGIRGEVVVEVLSDVDGRFDRGTEVVLDGTATTIVSSRPHQGRLLVGFQVVGDRNDAERLRGAEIHAEPADVSDEEQVYAHELVGLTVVDHEGTELGTVTDVIMLPQAAGYDLLEVDRPDGARLLLPAADDLVELVELEDGTWQLIASDLPDGLLDPDDAEPAGDAPDGGQP